MTAAADSKLTLLLVDDRPENLLSLEALLGDLGHHLVRANSGPEALRHLLQEECALVLLDVQMPGMDGFETAQLIRARNRTQHLPIVFITAINKSDEHVSRGYAVGAVDYLMKPVQPELLKAKVTALIGITQEARARTAELESVARAEQAERERVEAELRLANSHKEEYLAMLGHELRSPLMSITNSSYLLDQFALTNPRVQRHLDVIGRQAKHLTRLVDDLLDVARISGGKLQLHRERLDLRQVIKETVEDTGTVLDARSHALTTSLPGEPLWVEGDPVRLAQVLANLLTNAAKYTPSGGRIGLTAECQQDEVVVRIRDNGVGITPEVLPLIFEPFFQAERTLDRAEGGLGIGLAAARRLVEMHGGTLQAFSEGVGCGTELVVRLPVLGGVSTVASGA